MAFLWNTTHLVFKIIVKLLIEPYTSISLILSPSFLFQSWIIHRLQVDLFLVILINGGIEFVLTKLGQQDQFLVIPWCQEIKAVFDQFIDSVIKGKFDIHSLGLSKLLNKLVLPYFDFIVFKSGLFVLLGWVLGLIANFLLSFFISFQSKTEVFYVTIRLNIIP